MPSKRPIVRFGHIVENIDAIRSYTEGVSDEELAAPGMRRDAVERCLQRIAEAARKLGDQAEAYAPGMPWPQIRAFGNVLRHDYDDVVHDLIAETVRRHLPPLRGASVAAVARLEAEGRT